MSLTAGNIAIGSPSSIATPPAGEVTPFFNSDESPAVYSYKDENGTVFVFDVDDDANEDCCCEIAEDLIGKIGCSLERGMITADEFQALVSQGLTVTGAKTDDGNGNTTCSITLGASNVPVTGVSVSPTTKNPLAVAAQFAIIATVAPSNASNKTLIWSSSNVSKVTVNQSGICTGIATGSAIITVTTADGLFTATCTVTVP